MIIDLPYIAQYRVTAAAVECLHAAAGEQETAKRLQRGLPRAAQMLMQGIAPLHAAALQTPTGAVAIVGNSSTGKSTLAAALSQRGLGVLADDLTGLTLVDGSVMALPGYAGLTLWREAVSELGFAFDRVQQVAPDLQKFIVTPETPATTQPQPVRILVLLGVHNTPEIVSEAVTGMQKFRVVGNYMYNTRLVDAHVDRNQFFALSAAIAATVPIWRVRRPRIGWTANQVADIVEQLIR